ncbi:MAG: SsrA-binding protein SmpB [Tissierellia bacterium]|nr:SsrA-binding protein SmpB [Tissierellia bacterium]
MIEKDKLIAKNKKARHEYTIEETFEAGIVLTGTEVKSIRLGKVSINEAFCFLDKGEVYVNNMHVTPYEFGNRFNTDPIRKRKLLLNRREINKIVGKINEKGYTLVPLSINLRKGLVKVDIALAKGKKIYDKRQDIAKKDADRRIEQALRRY